MVWDFLDFVLLKMGFGERWRKWIFGCLSAVNYSVIVNGKLGNNLRHPGV